MESLGEHTLPSFPQSLEPERSSNQFDRSYTAIDKDLLSIKMAYGLHKILPGHWNTNETKMITFTHLSDRSMDKFTRSKEDFASVIDRLFQEEDVKLTLSKVI